MTFLKKHWHIFVTLSSVAVLAVQFYFQTNHSLEAMEASKVEIVASIKQVDKRIDQLQKGQVSLCSAIQRRQGLSDFDCGSLVGLTVEVAGQR